MVKSKNLKNQRQKPPPIIIIIIIIIIREDAKRFYRELGKKTMQIEKPPDIGLVKKF